MLRPPMKIVLAALMLATAARASSISNEVAVARSQTSPDSPRTGNLSDTLIGSVDLSDKLNLVLGATLTLEGTTPADQAGQFGSSASAIPLFTFGLDYDFNDHFTTGLTFDFSPKSVQHSGTEVTVAVVNGRETIAPALLRSESQESSGTLDFGYDTAGDSDLEFSFVGGISVTRFETTQNVEAIRTATGAIADDTQLRTYCQTHVCSRPLLAALRKQPAVLASQRYSLAVTATFSQDTDVTLGGDAYHYNQDPAAIGYYSVALAGRSTITGGAGIPIAPLQWLVRPEFAHRFGDLSVRIWLQRGQYVKGMGQDTSGGGVRVQYRFTEAWKGWVTLSGQRDFDETGTTLNSGAAAVGGAYQF